MSSVASNPAIVTAGIAPPHAHDRHFRTDHLIADIKGRSVRGGAVTLSAQAVKFVLQLTSTAILSRLLTPGDFGLVAMVAAFTGFVALFKDLGLTTATVQRDHVTHEQVSTLFWINVALSAVLMIMTAALAPAIAWFYGEPRLTWIVLAVAGTFILGGLSAQHTALLRRQMRFTVLAAIDVSSFAAGLIAAVALAWYGFGYWSLVGMGAAHLLWNVILSWACSGWRPGLPRRGCGVRPMIAFGKNLTGFNLLNYWARNGDNIAIGRYWGAASLGLYSKAYGLLMMPLQQINAPIAAVAVPVLSRLQHEPQMYKRYYLRALRMIVYLNGLLTAVCAAFAPEIVLLLLGQQWVEATLLFKVLALGAVAQGPSATVGWIYISLGKTDRMMRYGTIAVPAIVLSFLVGLPWGPLGVAIAYVTVWNLFVLPLSFVHALKDSPVSIADLLRTLWRPLAVIASLYLVCESARALLMTWPPAYRIAFGGVTAGAFVFVCIALSPSIRQEISSLALTMLKRKSSGMNEQA